MNNPTWEGLLLRSERIRQNRGQKEICIGLCVPSYLCKIEKGQAVATKELLTELFKRLGICYETDELFIKNMHLMIKEYFRKYLYGLDTSQIVHSLVTEEVRLLYSSLRIDYLLIKGLAGDNTVIPLLKEIAFGFSKEQEAFYYLLVGMYTEEREKKLSFYGKASEIMHYSYFMLMQGYAYLENSNYTGIHSLEGHLIPTALEEGNIYTMAEYYLLKGTAYGSLDMDEMMLIYYKRAIRMCENTGWAHIKDNAYYNIGAVYLCQNRFAEAKEYLNKVENETFLLLHKKALLAIRSGDFLNGKEYLKQMKCHLLDEEEGKLKHLIYQEAVMELEEDFVLNPEYELLLDKLIVELKKHMHFGFLYSFKDVIISTYIAHRKYKKALEFQNEISANVMNR